MASKRAAPTRRSRKSGRKRLVTMQNTRRVVQVLAFLAFVYLFLLTIGHVRVVPTATGQTAVLALVSRAPVDTFLRIDPLIGISTMVAARKVIHVLVWYALPIVVLTVIAGRFFCGWLCPLGTSLDAFDILFFRRRRAARPGVRWRNTKYYLLAVILLCSLLSAQIAYFFDPIALLVRSFTLVFVGPVQMVLRAIGMLAPVREHLPIVTHNRLMPDLQMFFRANLAVLAIFAAIVGANYYSRRFWCRNLCPLGALLALFSRVSIIRRIVSDRCNACSRCERDCKMAAILPDPKEYLAPECIYCYSCTSVCPRGATKIIPSFVGTGYRTELSLSRRRLVQALGVGLAWTAISKTHVSAKNARDSKIKTSSPQLIRPPGALPEDDFLATCIRCSECMKVCPTNGLQPAVLEAGLEGLWTPILVPRIGECTQNCNLCSQVCSTQAIQPFEIKEKEYIFIGTAVIDRSACVVWNSDRPCLVCDEYCSYHAIHWKVVDGVRRPFVNERKCTGCGICETACPIQPQSAVRVFSFGDKRHMTREEQRRWSKAQAG